MGLYLASIALGASYRSVGEHGLAFMYFQKALKIAKRIGLDRLVAEAEVNLLLTKYFISDPNVFIKETRRFLSEKPEDYPGRLWIHFYIGDTYCFLGKFPKALEEARRVLEGGADELLRAVTLRQRGNALRALGEVDAALESYRESLRGLLELSHAHSVVPGLELARTALLADRKLSREELSLLKTAVYLGSRGPSFERICARELGLYLKLLSGASSDALAKLLELSKRYAGLYQVNYGMTLATALLLALKGRHPVFFDALEELGKESFSPGCTSDALLGPAFKAARALRPKVVPEGEGVRARLLGGFSLSVDGAPVDVGELRRRKSFWMLVYLLLAPKHALTKERLFRMLWPEERYSDKTRFWLYSLAYDLRKRLRLGDYLRNAGDSYVLDNTRTDLEELEEKVKKAELLEGKERAKLLKECSSLLSRGELLPGLEDKYVDEYREYLSLLSQRVSELSTEPPML